MLRTQADFHVHFQRDWFHHDVFFLERRPEAECMHTCHFDANTGREYFVNKETRSVQHALPAEDYVKVRCALPNATPPALISPHSRLCREQQVKDNLMFPTGVAKAIFHKSRAAAGLQLGKIEGGGASTLTPEQQQCRTRMQIVLRALAEKSVFEGQQLWCEKSLEVSSQPATDDPLLGGSFVLPAAVLEKSRERPAAASRDPRPARLQLDCDTEFRVVATFRVGLSTDGGGKGLDQFYSCMLQDQVGQLRDADGGKRYYMGRRGHACDPSTEEVIDGQVKVWQGITYDLCGDGGEGGGQELLKVDTRCKVLQLETVWDKIQRDFRNNRTEVDINRELATTEAGSQDRGGQLVVVQYSNDNKGWLSCSGGNGQNQTYRIVAVKFGMKPTDTFPSSDGSAISYKAHAEKYGVSRYTTCSDDPCCTHS